MKSEKPKAIYKDLIAKDIKECKGFEGINEELAQKIADAIRVYTEIIYNCFIEERFEEQKAKVILMSKNEKNKAA